jgi:hypothetical protein
MECLSLKQALAISRASQFMVGLPFDQDYPQTTRILCITPCPHNPVLKEKFIQDYDTYGLTDLTEYIEEDQFDVIVIARNLQDQGACVYTYIKSYMENKTPSLAAA